MATKQATALVRQPVESKIRLIRGQRVILDSDLAQLYGVSVKRLNEQVKRNMKRFPPDFMLRITEKEHNVLRSQIATSNKGRGGRRYTPLAFTEHGAIMAANVLHSSQATEMSVFVVRAFVRLRELLVANKNVAAKLSELEERLETHDVAIRELIQEINRMMRQPSKLQKPIGFIKPVLQKKNTTMRPSTVSRSSR